MPITYSAFGNLPGGGLWNFHDTSGGDDSLINLLTADSGGTNSRVSFSLQYQGDTFTIFINGQFASPPAAGTSLPAFIQTSLNATVSKIESRINGQLNQTEEYSPGITVGTLINLWDSLSGLQSGFSGDDIFYGSTTAGQTSGDSINGYGGNDKFYGYGDGGDYSADIFFGGSGNDTAYYRGIQASYVITSIDSIYDPSTGSMISAGGKAWKISDITGLDGTDYLYEVETVQFADQTLTLIPGGSSSSGSSSSSGNSSGSTSSGGSGTATANLPTIAAAPTQGAMTLIAYGPNAISSFFEPDGPGPGSIDFYSLVPDADSTTQKFVTTIIEDGELIRIEGTGPFSENPRNFATFGDFIGRYPNATVSKFEIYIRNTKIQEEIYSPAQRSTDLINQEYNLSKLQQLYSGNDVFIGSTSTEAESDMANGYGGNDTFYGNAGGSDIDIFHGGDGTDTAVYRGRFSDYTIEAVNWIYDPVTRQGNLQGFYVSDNVAGRDGADHLHQVERLQFSDYVVSLPDLQIIGITGGSSSGSSGSSSSNSSSSASSGSSSSSNSSTTNGGTTAGTGTGSTTGTTTPVAPIVPNGTERTGSNSNDRLQGGSGPDVVSAGGGNDVIVGSDGNDYIDGGQGVDQLTYSSRTTGITFALDTGGNVQLRSGSKVDTLVNVERVVFSDKAYALDLGGSAGNSAKAIIATFGRSAVPEYLGIAMTLTDQGAGIADLATIVVSNRMLPSDNGQFVQTVFNNVVGRAPNSLELLQFKGMLDRGEATQASLLTLAATTSLAEAVMNEIAISGVALEYLPTLA